MKWILDSGAVGAVSLLSGGVYITKIEPHCPFEPSAELRAALLRAGLSAQPVAGGHRGRVVGWSAPGEMWLYTNRGIGLIAPAVRFLCRPEITLLRLQTL